MAEERADELKLLEADLPRWEATLRSLLAETEESLTAVARSNRDERDQALADLTEERDRLREVLRRFGPQDFGPDDDDFYDDDDDVDDDHVDQADNADNPNVAPDVEPANQKPRRKRSRNRSADKDQSQSPNEKANGKANEKDGGGLTGAPTVTRLEASWAHDRVVLWVGSPSGNATIDVLDHLVDDAGAATIDWVEQSSPSIPGGGRTVAVSAPLTEALGWLVGVGAGVLATDAGPSVRWLGEIAAWATELVAQGRMVPTLRRSKAKAPGQRQSTAAYAVEWVPAVVDRARLRKLASHMPAPVKAYDRSASAERLARTVLGAGVDAVCRVGAARLITAATAPVARSRRDVSEALLAGLDGAPFAAAPNQATQIAEDLRRWASPVLADTDVHLSVRLEPPEADGGWLLAVDASVGKARQPQPLDKVLPGLGGAKVQQIEAELRRLGHLLPSLSRTGRRGQVVLGGDEAWDLMTRTGPVLVAAGFDVRVPAASTGRRVAPRLRLEADPGSGPAGVGAHQLASVRWSVLFDDVELDAAAIARLSAQARPLVQARGRWVELDKADLEAAAAAIAHHAATTELSGAAILRHAVGLEDSSLAGPVVVDGAGWAVDLVRGATSEPPEPLGSPDGFVGELRTYQADARGWLAFLDRVGLGGILAMDMGLGKTPTVLAHLLAHRGDGPVLVIAPPAVLGNWHAESARFSPDLRVHVHHGAARASADDLPKIVGDADLVLTTYATAVRDVEALEAIHWDRVVLDEAQAIKNPASEAAGELRRIPARSRLALTGTPVENGLGDLWAILDFVNPGLVGPRPAFVAQLGKANGKDSAPGEAALRALNGLLVFRRTKAEPEIAAELPDKIDELDHCGMTPEQIGLYQAVLDNLLGTTLEGDDRATKTGHVLAAITALKQICDHPAAYLDGDEGPLAGRSGKLARLDELVDTVFAAGERMLIFTHFARWGDKLAEYLTTRTGKDIACYHGGLSRGVRDRLVREFQEGTGAGALVLSIKAGGSGLNLTAANHVVLYDRWWNPAVEDQARDRAWRIGQQNTVVSHRLVCPGTVDEQVEEVVAGKRRIADMVLPASSSVADLSPDQLRTALGLRPDALIDDTDEREMEAVA